MPADQLSYRRPSTPFTRLTLGQRVKWLLIRRKLTQTAAAQKVGVTQATIANIVNGARKPSAETLMKLARGLDSSPSFIMYGTGFQLSYAEPESDVQAELLELHKVLSETEQEMLIIFARTLARKPVIAKPIKRKTKPHLALLQDT
ncbi:helix-turn-helix domain-containing protein [Comamonas sp. UBA7528]|uniref:helix-turn-helix domain-containing protein n=1 Tax=Comamonas sp. UBA7528 TaxID=1946391 RepID=UPI0025B92CB8|nr:helix-turn-helix transcriptional regulator [Comamonas sp. UBA7528]